MVGGQTSKRGAIMSDFENIHRSLLAVKHLQKIEDVKGAWVSGALCSICNAINQMQFTHAYISEGKVKALVEVRLDGMDAPRGFAVQIRMEEI